MKNAHGIATGRSGAGKSTFVREFVLPEVPRYVVLDQEGTYTADREVRDPERMAKLLLQHGSDPTFRVAYMADLEPGYLATMEMIYQVQSRRESPPILVVVDEAHLYTSSREIPKELGLLVRAGRKHGIAVLAITQRDVDLHRDIRVNSALRIAFYQDSGYSEDFRRSWFADRLDKVSSLELPPSGDGIVEPEPGTHYMTDPPGIDPVRYYRDAMS